MQADAPRRAHRPAWGHGICIPLRAAQPTTRRTDADQIPLGAGVHHQARTQRELVPAACTPIGATGGANGRAQTLSEAALPASRSRLGAKAQGVAWLTGDITQVELPRHAHDVWHRAAVHLRPVPQGGELTGRAVRRACRPSAQAKRLSQTGIDRARWHEPAQCAQQRRLALGRASHGPCAERGVHNGGRHAVRPWGLLDAFHNGL